MKYASLDMAFWQNVIPTEGCWHWSGYVNEKGYGRATFEGLRIMAHRLALLIVRGVEVPDGLEVDHICRNRGCVNPDHLEVVDHRTNVLRGEGPCADNAKKTHCAKGHELVPIPRQSQAGNRWCHECNVATSKERYYRLRELREAK